MRNIRTTALSTLVGAGLVLGLVACGGQPAGPPSYYVDGAAGDDTGDGRSPDTAWNTLDKVNSVEFVPGDRILFKAGTEFAGQLAPKGSGSADAPIIVDMYGEGGKPVIAAAGAHHEALLLKNQDYWEVSNLELTNRGPTEETFRYGVRVLADNYGTMRHIHLKKLYVHDVNGSLVKNDSGEGHGIVWENGGDDVPSRFDDLLIEDCHLLRTDRNGISGYAKIPNGRGEKWFPSLNVVIRGNLLEDIGGDGIKPWGCDGAVVERNVVRNGRQRAQDYAAGIWPWNCDNTIIQFNEVSGMKGRKDGQAFDSDAYCHNTVFQYNYSHDNDGGFMLICGRENTGTTIRYNISQNDRARLFHFYDLIEGTRIYNNVFYVAKDIDLHLFLWTPGGSGWATDTLVANNIFQIEGVGRNSAGISKKKVDDGAWIAKPGFGGATNVAWQNNVLYGNSKDVPKEWTAMDQDPLLANPGSGGEGLDSVEGYRLQEGSPLIHAGQAMPDNGGRDYWGNPVSVDGKPSIGAFEPPAR